MNEEHYKHPESDKVIDTIREGWLNLDGHILRMDNSKKDERFNYHSSEIHSILLASW